MKKAARRVFLALAIVVGLAVVAAMPFLLLTPRAPRPPPGIDSPAKLEAYLRALVANETPPALDITVMKNGAVVYARAFGIVDSNGRVAEPGQIYHFWSVTKLFTATAILQLVEDGKIGLDDPLARHLPDFKTTLASGAPADVTIRQLLDHTSGMKDIGPGDLFGWIHHGEDPPVGDVEIVRQRMAAYRKLRAGPGGPGAYSNGGYILLGALVEAVSGQSFEAFVRARILGPLKLDRTDFVYRPEMAPLAVTGSHPLFHIFTPPLLVIHHDWFSAWVERTVRRRMWLKPLYTDYSGPTALVGSGADLARFGEAFLEGGELDGNRILKPETVAAMLDSGFGGNTGPDGDRMGLGWHWWDKAPIPFKGHGGDGPGFRAQLAVFPEKQMVIVILANDALVDRVGLTSRVAAAFQ